MIFLFTASKGIGSQLIRWGLSTDISHMAVLDNDSNNLRPLDIVLESKLSTGVDITWLKSFRSHRNIVTALRPKAHIKDAYQQIANSVVGTDYDVAAVGYLALSVLLCKKLLGTRLPIENKWADSNDNFCSEILMTLEEELTIRNVDLLRYTEGMLTPDRAREDLIDSGEFDGVSDLFKI